MIRVSNRLTVDQCLSSKWVTEEKIDEDKQKEDMKERKEIVQKSKQQNSEQMEVDEEQNDSNEKVYRDDDSRSDIILFLQNFDLLSFGDFELAKWVESEYRSNDFMKIKLTPKKLLRDFCFKALLKYPNSKVTLSENAYKGNITLVNTIEEGESDSDKTQLQITQLDIDFEVYEDSEASSVVQFNKNDVMDQFEFKGFINEIRESYQVGNK